MKGKKLISSLLVSALLAGSIIGCGGSAATESADAGQSENGAASETTGGGVKRPMRR